MELKNGIFRNLFNHVLPKAPLQIVSKSNWGGRHRFIIYFYFYSFRVCAGNVVQGLLKNALA